MVDTSSMPLGSVTVEVKASLNKLVSDFAAARVQSQAFANDMSRAVGPTNATTAATANLAKQLDGMIRQYQPLTAARTRFAQESAVLNQAEQAGLITFAESSALQRDMAKAMESTTLKMGEQRVGLYGWARETEHHLRAFRLLLTFVGVDLAARIGEFAAKTLETTGAIKEQAVELGLTTAQLQEYRAIAPSVGMAAADMDKAFAGLDNSLGEISLHGKSSQAAKLFKALGVSVTDTAGQVKSRDAIFKELIDRLGQVGDKTQQTTAASLIFGEAGKKMGQLFAEGSAGVDKLREAVRQTGAVLSDRQIQDADEAAKKLDMVKTVLSAEIASTVSNNAQAITGLANALAHLTSALLGFLNSDPQLALGFLGALGGAFLGGPYGAAAGFVGGAVAGDQMQNAQIAQNTQRRKARLEQAREQVARLEGQAQPGDESILGGLFTVHHGNPGSAGNLKDAKAEYAKLQAQDKTASAAEAAAAAQPPKKGPNIDLKNVLAPKGPRAPKAKFDEFEKEMDAETAEYLQLQAAATGDIQEQNRLAKEVIDLKVKEKDEDIKRQVKHGELTAKEGQQLIHQNAINAAAEKEAEDRKTELERIQLQAQYADEITKLNEDRLNTEKQLARTNDKRKEIDAALLDSKQQQAVSALQEQIDEATIKNDTNRVAQLTGELAKLRANQLGEWQAFNVEHLTGIEKFRNDLPATVQEINDQLDKIRFDQFTERLQRAADMAKSIGDAFGQFFGDLASFKNPLDALKSLIGSLAQTMTQNVIVKPISDWATQHIGVPLAKQTFGKSMTSGPDALTPKQFDMALAQATGTLGGFEKELPGASSGIGSITTAASPASASLNTLASAAQSAASALAGISASGGGGGGGGGLGSLSSLFGGGGGDAGTIMGASGLGDTFDVTSGLDLGSMFDAGTMLDMTSMGIGFATGGFTGSGADHETAGVVHKNEFVMSSGAVSQYGLPMLGAMNTGDAPVLRAGGGPGPRSATAGPADMSDAAAMLMQAAQMLMDAAKGMSGGGGGGGGIGGLIGMGLGLLGGGLFGGGGKNAGGLISSLFGGGKSASSGGGAASMLGLGGSGLFGASDMLDMSSMGIGFSGGGHTGFGPDSEIAGPVHRNEFVWDADTTRRFMPLLSLVASGRLPSFQGPGIGQKMGGTSGQQPPTINVGDIHLHGVSDERAARQSANQFAAEMQTRVARVARRGMIQQ